MKLSSVLTVCTGNICRSPMAQGWLATRCPHLTVQSAGVSALTGTPAEPLAVQLMAELGIDIRAHRARPLTEALVRTHALILVAELAHKRHIEQVFPFSRGRVYRMAEHLRLDTPDPYQQDRPHYQHSLALITAGLEHWAQRLNEPQQPPRSS